ncbi:glycoside hydrolase family 16 protein [Hymenobacter sp. BT188]|uniref:glycoside hydrolase family 16 protein n=1 Tax=Hymenobacter sp. BT188 TaxID=2763504 RepID=UPI0016510D73|nr:glycoside hydrolase family 16 protein [Hymenobacter sp. BT188]MBC6605207.1 glycoside hydrolase family 16 protein [Hymenobacter sp. BT188]
MRKGSLKYHRSLGGIFVGAVLCCLTATACTEEKEASVPAPTPTPPAATEVNADPRDYNQYTELVWSDEFDGSALNQTKWTYEVSDNWFNNELQATTNSSENLFLTGGNLTIQAKREQLRNRQYTSARIITKGKQDFAYGRIDVRAKLPKGKGIWPAIWMLGSNDSQAPWPACGEIDIMELRGSQPAVNISTVHFGNTVAERKFKGTEIRLPSGDFSDDYHIFSLVRSKGQLRWFLDGQQYFTITPNDASPYPFDNKFYMILNVAVGGDFDGNPDASTTFPKQMQVDYVRYYQYK